MTARMHRVSYKSDLVKLSIVKECLKHSKILYGKGHTGKCDKWVEVANEMKEKHKMDFKWTGIRDHMRDYLATVNKEELEHLIETGVTHNEDGKLSDMHELERCTLDLVDAIDLIENEAENKKKDKENQGKIEEELRVAATSGLKLSSDIASESSKTKPSRTNKNGILQESVESLKSFQSGYLDMEKQKQLELAEHNNRVLQVQETQAKAAQTQAEASIKNAEAALLSQKNMERMMDLFVNNNKK